MPCHQHQPPSAPAPADCVAAVVAASEAAQNPIEATLPGLAAQVWALCHGAALLDIDDAIGFLRLDQRPQPRDLAQTLLRGLRL